MLGRALTVVVWVHIKDRRLLAVVPRGTEVWFLPGGLPEASESHAETAAREVAEETGLSLQPGGLIELTRVQAEAWGRPGSVELVCMTGRPAVEMQPHPRGEISEIGWINTGDRSECAPAVQLVIDYLHGQGVIG